MAKDSRIIGTGIGRRHPGATGRDEEPRSLSEAIRQLACSSLTLRVTRGKFRLFRSPWRELRSAIIVRASFHGQRRWYNLRRQ
jgi:hypothetical protein